MATLHFLPWCRIEKTYSVGEITIIPIRQGDPVSDLPLETLQTIHKILSGYKDLEGRSVRHFAIIQYEEFDALADLTGDQFQTMNDCLQLSCLAGLAKRAYFNPMGPYCNTDCFISYGQRYTGSQFTALSSRRRDGQTSAMYPLSKIAMSMPVHISNAGSVVLDDALLLALTDFRKSADPDEWGRWQNAIACFNQANTDNETVRPQAEWVLMCSAFEHILQARSEAKDVARRLADVILPGEPVQSKNGKRRSAVWTNPEEHIRFEWMREFYRIRGDFAHGKLLTRRPTVWNEMEHLVLAAMAFPLVVRCLLQKTGHYSLTDIDIAQISCFERLADEKFLEDPPDQQYSGDSVWSRLISEERWSLVTKKAFANLEQKGFFSN
ncbi:MAG: hypothetical protein OEY86_12395 [Nitrospira sp.]|nr:hypothetical protein [Nitrospira sp.]